MCIFFDNLAIIAMRSWNLWPICMTYIQILPKTPITTQVSTCYFCGELLVKSRGLWPMLKALLGRWGLGVKWFLKISLTFKICKTPHEKILFLAWVGRGQPLSDGEHKAFWGQLSLRDVSLSDDKILERGTQGQLSLRDMSLKYSSLVITIEVYR